MALATPHQHKTDKEQQVFLAADVSICVLNGSLIFMAPATDEYISLDAADTATVMKALKLDGKAHQYVQQDATESSNTEDSVLEDLSSRGLLTSSGVKGQHAFLLPAQRSMRELAGPFVKEALNVSIGEVLRLLAAWAMAHWVLRSAGVQGAIERVKRRRTRRSLNVNESQIEKVVATYRALRVFLFSDRDKCLLKSFVLLDFLLSSRLDATWVFGVRDDPFLAHCWLERDGVLLDDDVEQVCDFTRLREV